VLATDIIRFATEASYPPFEYVDAQNNIQGFDIDIAQALCEEIGVECAFTNQSFEGLIPGLKFRRFDAIIAGIDVTPARSKQVLFTKSYYHNSAEFITKKHQLNSITSLRHRRVGVQNGTTYQGYLSDKYKNIIVVNYDSYQNALIDLKNDRIEAVFGETAVVEQWLRQDSRLRLIGEKIKDQDHFGAGLSIAVNPYDIHLKDRFNDALDSIRIQGIYQTIYNKWFLSNHISNG
jgi:arginine transport system substrate-binding protein